MYHTCIWDNEIFYNNNIGICLTSHQCKERKLDMLQILIILSFISVNKVRIDWLLNESLDVSYMCIWDNEILYNNNIGLCLTSHQCKERKLDMLQILIILSVVC